MKLYTSLAYIFYKYVVSEYVANNFLISQA